MEFVTTRNTRKQVEAYNKYAKENDEYIYDLDQNNGDLAKDIVGEDVEFSKGQEDGYNKYAYRSGGNNEGFPLKNNEVVKFSFDDHEVEVRFKI